MSWLEHFPIIASFYATSTVSITSSCYIHLPVSRGRYKVQAAVDSVVWHRPAVHPRLCIQEVLTLTVDVINNWLPTAKMEKRSNLGRKQQGIWTVQMITWLTLTWHALRSYAEHLDCVRTAHQLLLSTASPNPGVSTMVSVSWTPPSLISTFDCST